MTRLQMFTRTSFLWFCAATLSCGNPKPVGSSTVGGPSTSGSSNATGTGTEAGAGVRTDIKLAPIPVATSTDTGSAVEKITADGGNCGVDTSTLVKLPADLLLILDRSGSMTRAMDTSNECRANDTTCKQRWAALVSGLSAVFTSSAGSVNWGLKLYPSDNNCGVTPAMDVNISANATTTIQQRISAATQMNGTPTRSAIKAGMAYLKSVTTASSKYILLATDGEPNCLDGTLGTGDVAGTVAAISEAAAAGYKTYVIGVGPETGNLDNFAAAGGTEKSYPALSPADLAKALTAIVGSAISCTFDLNKTPPVPENVAVEFDDNKSLRAPRDTTRTNGWDYTSSTQTTIQLFGEWCDRVSNGTYKSAKVLMGCPDKPIP